MQVLLRKRCGAPPRSTSHSCHGATDVHEATHQIDRQHSFSVKSQKSFGPGTHEDILLQVLRAIRAFQTILSQPYLRCWALHPKAGEDGSTRTGEHTSHKSP